MVPGMTERERRIADALRLERLANTGCGLTRMTPASRRPLSATGPHPDRLLAVWRCGLLPALSLGRRLRVLQGGTVALRRGVNSAAPSNAPETLARVLPSAIDAG